MNHPKGEESTILGEPCSLTYHLSSTALYCGRASPDKLRLGRTFPKGWDLSGGSRPFFFRQGETRAAGFVRRSQGDPPDGSDRDDQLLALVFRVHRQREEAVAGLARERSQGQPLAVT